jgi:hypothetical protein
VWKNLKLGQQRKQNYSRMTLLNFDREEREVNFFVLFGEDLLSINIHLRFADNAFNIAL